MSNGTSFSSNFVRDCDCSVHLFICEHRHTCTNEHKHTRKHKHQHSHTLSETWKSSSDDSEGSGRWLTQTNRAIQMAVGWICLLTRGWWWDVGRKVERSQKSWPIHMSFVNRARAPMQECPNLGIWVGHNCHCKWGLVSGCPAGLQAG